ncbi:unnamed protein product [Ceutorhynchus assimilis]|uniref:Ima1 N-terminal domain-containing protein n=1 Tax=Ceutorhynchus assimilis TaxID=467358 RepID=A0A9N9Q906_9CUCU|nr:unnamed protein product [Ceutorhynchus assimilis]
MDFVFEHPVLSLGISAVILLLLGYAAMNIWFIIQNGFFISVNCWFCNQNSKMLYSERNCFVCPLCCQYNGFTKDGGYNKVIEAQHKLSDGDWTAPETSSIASNGLCNTCNRNHELKVIQLSQFEPMNYKNYDKEIQHFEEQLEKTYELCETCLKTVKKTIREQNAWIFGYKLPNSKKRKLIMNQDSKTFSLGINMFLFVLSFLNVFILCDLDVFLPNESTLPGYVMSDLYLSSLGFITEYSKLIAQNNFSTKFNQLLAWFIVTLISLIDPKNSVIPYLEYLEIIFSLYLTYIYAATCIKCCKARKISYAKSFNSTNNTSFDSSNSTNGTNITSFASAQNSFNQSKEDIPMRTNPVFSPGFNKSVKDNPFSNQLQQQSPSQNMSFASAIPRNNLNLTNRNLGPEPASSKSVLNTFFDELKISSPSKKRKTTQNYFKNPQLPPVFHQNSNLRPRLSQRHKLSSDLDTRACPVSDQNTEAISIRDEAFFSINLFNQEMGSCSVRNRDSFNRLSDQYNDPNYTATSSLKLVRLPQGSLNRPRSQSNFNISI